MPAVLLQPQLLVSHRVFGREQAADEQRSGRIEVIHPLVRHPAEHQPEIRPRPIPLQRLPRRLRHGVQFAPRARHLILHLVLHQVEVRRRLLLVDAVRAAAEPALLLPLAVPVRHERLLLRDFLLAATLLLVILVRPLARILAILLLLLLRRAVAVAPGLPTALELLAGFQIFEVPVHVAVLVRVLLSVRLRPRRRSIRRGGPIARHEPVPELRVVEIQRPAHLAEEFRPVEGVRAPRRVVLVVGFLEEIVVRIVARVVIRVPAGRLLLVHHLHQGLTALDRARAHPRLPIRRAHAEPLVVVVVGAEVVVAVRVFVLRTLARRAV